MHAIRAALFYATEVNWIGTRSLPEAMERIREKAKAAKPGEWIIVAGGWTPAQFAEKRRPTQAELVAAAPDNPVFCNGPVLVNPFLRHPLAGHLLLYGIGAAAVA
jgi:predicted amidohydrolase YtcJ